ncbi:MAG: hypothetical protein MZU97_26645 [Bacillus subtilis]|nr:hypothetical protein [Bacillus subtilis]
MKNILCSKQHLPVGLNVLPKNELSTHQRHRCRGCNPSPQREHARDAFTRRTFSPSPAPAPA